MEGSERAKALKDAFRGSAQVRVDCLRFQDGLLFAVEDCPPSELPNHVPALIAEAELQRLLAASGLPASSLQSGQPPQLNVSVDRPLQCLHGKHRLAGAKASPSPANQWWTVDLYSANVSPEVILGLIEQCRNESIPGDGEIYWKIRHYQRVKDRPGEQRWWARLSPNKRRNLKQFLKHARLAQGFDTLLRNIPGLRDGIRLGTLSTNLASHCDEEWLHYLEQHILQCWKTLASGDVRIMSLIDTQTVQILEGRAPRLCLDDRKYLRGQLAKGRIFPCLTTEPERNKLWSSLMDLEGVIPSIYTFFEDFKYLNHCHVLLRTLLDSPYKGTTRTSFEKAFTSPASGRVGYEYEEGKYDRRPTAPQDQFFICYQHLWTFCMRHWWEEPGQNRKKLPVATPRTERGTPASPGPRLASHALEIGFDSPTIRSLASSRSYEQTSPESDLDLLDRRISARATKLRVGVPLEGEQAFDQARLFWDGLQESSPPAADLSLMALRRSWFQAFLGPPTSAHSHGGFTPMGDIATPSSYSTHDSDYDQDEALFPPQTSPLVGQDEALFPSQTPPAGQDASPVIGKGSSGGEASGGEASGGPYITFWIFSGSDPSTQHRYRFEYGVITRAAAEYASRGYMIMTPEGRCLNVQDVYDAVQALNLERLVLCRRGDQTNVGRVLGFASNVEEAAMDRRP